METKPLHLVSPSHPPIQCSSTHLPHLRDTTEQGWWSNDVEDKDAMVKLHGQICGMVIYPRTGNHTSWLNWWHAWKSCWPSRNIRAYNPIKSSFWHWHHVVIHIPFGIKHFRPRGASEKFHAFTPIRAEQGDITSQEYCTGKVGCPTACKMDSGNECPHTLTHHQVELITTCPYLPDNMLSVLY